MTSTSAQPAPADLSAPSDPDALSGRRVLVPGGTGTVGTGVVRRYLAAGADVVVPTRTQHRADEFRRTLGEAATERLHLVVHDYTTFAGAEDLAAQMELNLGGIDDVVAPIGGWWAGKRLWEIDEADWQKVFVGLATTHMAVLRAALPRMTSDGAYTLIVGDSATWPVPGSGLVSMEQSAVLMMQRVLEAELQGAQRVFVLVLGPVGPVGPGTDRAADSSASTLSADQIGAVTVGVSTSRATGRTIAVHNLTEVSEALALLRAD